MIAKNCLIFGGSGQIGRHLIRKLTKNNYKVTVVTRNIHQKSLIIKTQANAGYIDIIETNIFDEKKNGNTFENIHSLFPSILSKLCKEYNLQKFIHVSALGVSEAKDSNYAKSKLEGEKKVLDNFSLATILRPSIVYSVDDKFTTNFMSLLNLLPIFPLYYSGKTKFMPIHCSDLTEIIYYVISKNIEHKIIECVGPETFTFKEILQKLLSLIDKKRILMPLPLFIAKMSSKLFELLPSPPITQDQLRLLKYDNISSGKYKTNSDIGLPSKHFFYKEVEKYSHMWREGGQFSKQKDILKEN